MSDQKATVGNIFGPVIVLAIFVVGVSPFALFEMNAHSGIKTEYTTTKIRWLDRLQVNSNGSGLVTLRDRAEARVVMTNRGGGYSALTESFFLRQVPNNLMQGQKYQFKLRCIKVGSLPNPIMHDSCEVISLEHL